ncbi:uncharacterized protein LOC121708066 [Alosa sapidissima]|uniref:uncharacterized protein LOC121708066 n=1 Tax=Alosa sapidissima TaxID=34773 RepID=UPI001C096E23|nr:uncharacterized protein LOC121708066 [Alosa sapidissima]
MQDKRTYKFEVEEFGEGRRIATLTDGRQTHIIEVAAAIFIRRLHSNHSLNIRRLLQLLEVFADAPPEPPVRVTVPKLRIVRDHRPETLGKVLYRFEISDDSGEEEPDTDSPEEFTPNSSVREEEADIEPGEVSAPPETGYSSLGSEEEGRQESGQGGLVRAPTPYPGNTVSHQLIRSPFRVVNSPATPRYSSPPSTSYSPTNPRSNSSYSPTVPQQEEVHGPTEPQPVRDIEQVLKEIVGRDRGRLADFMRESLSVSVFWNKEGSTRDKYSVHVDHLDKYGGTHSRLGTSVAPLALQTVIEQVGKFVGVNTRPVVDQLFAPPEGRKRKFERDSPAARRRGTDREYR